MNKKDMGKKYEENFFQICQNQILILDSYAFRSIGQLGFG